MSKNNHNIISYCWLWYRHRIIKSQLRYYVMHLTRH